MSTLFQRCAVVLALLASAGCGGGDGGPKVKVTGTVSVNGKPLDDGYITFRAADGKGSEAGAPVVAGNYTLTTGTGPKVVLITAGSPAAANAPKSSEEASKMKAEPKKPGDVAIDPATKGNNSKIEVKDAAGQSFDFALVTGAPK